MAKITFLGAGSTIFAKNILGDSMLSPALHDSHIALYDVDAERLNESKLMLDTINKNVNQGRAAITAHLGRENRKEALRGANYVVNAIQVGGYQPSTVIDFEIPKKYGLRQTIADTLGIGGIFRTLRTLCTFYASSCSSFNYGVISFSSSSYQFLSINNYIHKSCLDFFFHPEKKKYTVIVHLHCRSLDSAQFLCKSWLVRRTT